MNRYYEIKPRDAALGGGWTLQLLEDGEEAGGGVFPVPAEDPQSGIAWWNGLREPERAHWLMMAPRRPRPRRAMPTCWQRPTPMRRTRRRAGSAHATARPD